MRRFTFLQIFLTCLAIGFAVAVYLRIRSYQSVPSVPVEDSRPRLSNRSSSDAHPTLDSRGRLSSTGTTAATSTTAIQRERVREELLRQPIVAAATTSKPQQQQQQQKQQHQATVTPKQSLQPVARTTPPHPGVPVAHGPGGPTTQTAGPKDPNSDTAPPQLISLEFDPPEVHDGQEARVIMTAIDDMSGIRGISGTIMSPTSKALQGFAGQREGDTNRYIGRVQVPKNAETGLWRVNVITMSDNASNSVTLSLAQGTLQNAAALRVTSAQSDSTPPTLKSVRAEKRAMRVGEPNPIYIEATDEGSGVNLVSAVFQSPTKRARIGAGCRYSGDGDAWVCELSLPSCIDCGDWQLEQITLQDKAGNQATFRLDNPLLAAVKINIGGDSCDSEAPRLQAIAVDQPVVTLSRDPATITVTIAATDDSCGVDGVSAQYAGPGVGTGGFFPFKPDNGMWVGIIPLDPRAPRGTWRITSVQLTDKAHNLRIYYANDPLLANAIFVVR